MTTKLSNVEINTDGATWSVRITRTAGNGLPLYETLQLWPAEAAALVSALKAKVQ